MLPAHRSLILASTLFLTALPALAHAHPKTMTPAANSSVAAPRELSIEFSEALEPKFSKLMLTDSKGASVTQQPAVVDPADSKHITLSFPPLASGTYHVHWVSAAVDGHRMDGDYSFNVK